MRYAIVLRYIGVIILLIAAFMMVSAGVSAIYGMDTGFWPLMLSGIICGALGAFPLIFVPRTDTLSIKEGYGIVVGAWIMACFLGMFPYLLWGGEFTISNAWFESTSGFTTTGATVLTDIEALPHGLLFWRSLTHWLGGVGVVMFVLIILPNLGKTKMTLSSVELSTLAKDNYRYKSQKIVQILLVLYLSLTLAETLLLKFAGMSWFDAVNHSFSTVATGGFSTRNASIAYYNSFMIEGIVIFFMALAGIHFGLIFATFTGKRENIFRSEVAKFYIITFLVAALLIGLNLWRAEIYTGFFESLRYSLFQSVAIITTTGFATADTNMWTPLAVVILMFLTFQCACAGSTSGGIKSDRVLLAVKVLRSKILQQQHPNAIIKVKLNNVTQSDSVVGFAMLFIVIYLLIVFAGTLFMAAAGLDLTTSFSMVAACMGNVGPGFGEAGSLSNYAGFSPAVQTASTILMLLGRLEIFGFIQLFLLKWWK